MEEKKNPRKELAAYYSEIGDRHKKPKIVSAPVRHELWLWLAAMSDDAFCSREQILVGLIEDAYQRYQDSLDQEVSE